MGKVLMTGAGGGSSSSDDCTASANDILKGKTAVYNGSDDDIGTGTLELTGSATDGYVYSGKTYYNTDAHTIRTGSMTVGSILNFSAAVYSGRQILLKWQNPYAATGRPFGGVFVNYSTSSYPGTGGTRIYTGYGNNSASGGWSQVIVTLPNLSTTYYFSCTAYVSCSAGDVWGNTLNASCATANQQNLTFSSGSTYTIPSGYSSIDIFCVGGGGGGSRGEDGTSAHNGSGGGGGGGGACVTKTGISVSAGDVLTMSIGSGGTSNVANAITPGGTTSVSRSGTVLCSADGGKSAGFQTQYKGAGGSGGGDGGNGGGGYQAQHNPGNAGGNGSAAWTGTYYAGGGGGGGAGQDYGASGGNRGGGSGGRGNYRTGGNDSEGYTYAGGGWGSAGEAGTGGGGGGGGGGMRNQSSLGTDEGMGGNGGSGVVLIRLK